MKKYWIETYHLYYGAEEATEWINIRTLDFHPDLLAQLAELGIIELHGDLVSAGSISRIQKIFRLRNSLGVNLSGAAIILDLLERIEQLQDEVQRMQ